MTDHRIRVRLPTEKDYAAFDQLCTDMGFDNKSDAAAQVILDRMKGMSDSAANQLQLRKMSPAIEKRRDLTKQLGDLIEKDKDKYAAFVSLAIEHLSSTNESADLSSEFHALLERAPGHVSLLEISKLQKDLSAA